MCSLLGTCNAQNIHNDFLILYKKSNNNTKIIGNRNLATSSQTDSMKQLHGRVQSVVLDGKTSTAIPVLSGVPQGSVLGPLLFLIYINDSASEKLNSGTQITMYADDLLLYREINCPEDYLKLQQDVNRIANWVDVNKLKLNSKKCKYMIVSRLRGRSVPSCTLNLNCQTPDRVHQ